MLSYEIIKQTYREKQKSARDTPGSWPARTAKNPVVPTTVDRKAACTHQISMLLVGLGRTNSIFKNAYNTTKSNSHVLKIKVHTPKLQGTNVYDFQEIYKSQATKKTKNF